MAIEKLAGIHPGLAHYTLRHACGLPPVPQEQSIANKKRLEESDPKTRQKNLGELSRIAEDPERARQFLLRTAMILSQRRAESIVLNERLVSHP